MKIAPFVLLLLALAIPANAGIPFSSSIHPNRVGGADVDLGFFFDSLSPYGNWVETPAYGWAFVPDVATTDWRPYTDGQWLYTDAGWTWMSEEPFGWATYHYGSWNLDQDYGWMWVPGYQWAPARVDWRATEDSIGWAPLPSSYEVRPTYRLSAMDVGLPASAYVFVPARMFLQPKVAAYALPPGRVPGLFRSSRRYTRFRFDNDLIVNEGIPFVTVQQRIGRRIPRYQLVDLAPRYWGRRPGTRFAANRIEIFRPRVLRSAVAVPPARLIAGRSVMRISDAVRVRRVARARAQVFNLPSRPGRGPMASMARSAAVSQRDFGNSRRVGPPDTRQVVVGRDFGETRGVGRGAYRQQVAPRQMAPRHGARIDAGRKVEVRRMDVHKSRGRAEVRHPSHGAPSPRLRSEGHRSSRSARISPSGRPRMDRHSAGHSSRGGGRRSRGRG